MPTPPTAVGGAVSPWWPGRCCSGVRRARRPGRGRTGATRQLSPVRRANAARRAGCSRHPGRVAAGFVSPRPPGATRVWCAGEAGSTGASGQASALPVGASPGPPWSSAGVGGLSTSTTRRAPAASGGGAVCAGWPRRARAAGGCHKARADRGRAPWPRPAYAALAGAAAGRPATPRVPWSAPASAAGAGPLAAGWGGGCARGRAGPTPNRSASPPTRPSLASTSPWRLARGPYPRQSAASLLRPGGCRPGECSRLGRLAVL